MTKKKNSMMEAAKDTMGVGIASMAGYGVLGTMQGMPGMPSEAAGVTKIAGAGLQLANVGQLAKTGMGLTQMLSGGIKKKQSELPDKIRRMI